MSIPYSFTMLNLCIIYNTFFIDRKSDTIAFSKFAFVFGCAWIVASVNEFIWDDFTLTTLPLAAAMSVPALYMMGLITWSKSDEYKTFHHKLMLVFLPFSVVHIFNFSFFRADVENLLWGLVVHILLIIAGSINLTMFHTYLLESGEKKKLKHLVDQKTSELNRRYNQLELVNEEKSALFRIVLHDISNPMSAVMGYLDFSLNPKVDEEAKHRYLTGARRSAETVTKTIRQIRSMESMTENKNRFYAEDIDLHEAFATIETIFRPQFENKNVKLKVDYPKEEIYLTGNMELFCHSVLGNLVSNSLKFSHPDSTVVLTSKKIDGALKIFVIDQGTGIEKQKISQMFDISTSHSSRGTQGEAG
ncbi:MAG: HAMP domain-containing histidine kinase, partial [Bacteriovoracaceae bacterium]|nr:HAMP domain-containing histidine kinase [Bacteriovoracaceae bacterium]